MSHKVAFQRADGAHSKDGIVRLWTRVRKGGRGGKKKPRRKRDEPELGLGATMESVSLRSESEGHCEEEECFGAKKPEKEEETKSHSNDLTKQRFSCLAGAFCRDHPCADVRASC